jgi:hypothetical protein
MKINKDKCVFNTTSIEALGFEISQAVTTNLPEATADLWDNAFAHYKIYGNYREAFEAEIVDPEVAKFASIAKLLNNGKAIQTTTTRARAVNVSASTSSKKCNRCGSHGPRPTKH